MSLSLVCLVLGDHHHRTITIEIPKTKDVNILKKLIKQEQAHLLKNVDASNLNLWKVSFPLDDLETKLENLNLSDHPNLSPDGKKVGTFFKDVMDDCLHIIAKVSEVQPLVSLDPTQFLSLNCLVLGDSWKKVFTVEIHKTKNASILKKLIREERKADLFKNVDPLDLALWKVSVPVDNNLATESGNFTFIDDEAMSAVEELSNISSTFPVKKHLHVVVKPPAEREQNRDITPTEDIKGINKEIEKELKSISEVIKTFLKNPEPNTWVPLDYVKPSNHKYLTNLRIPSYPNGNPSLLLHNLDMYDDKEIKGIFGRGQRLCICNTSRSGKTRRIMESLTKYWGFYLVAGPDANSVGIRDLHDALNDIARYREWTSDLRDLATGQRVRQNNLNSQIASKPLRKVLAARVVIFELFLELAIVVNGKLQEKHKRIWLLFQLFEPPCSGNLHPFVRIIQKCLRHASNEALLTLIARFGDIREKHFSKQPHFNVMLDKAQRATRLYPRSFISSNNPTLYQSIVREIDKVVTRSRMMLVVSGTGLLVVDLEDSMALGVSKGGVPVFHQLGMFDTWLKLKPFLERYIPVSILETNSGCHLQTRIREYLLGRYHFSVSFLELFLKNGLESPHKLLNKYIEKHTACLPGNAFTKCDPELYFEVQLKGFDRERLESGKLVLQLEIPPFDVCQIRPRFEKQR